MLSWYEGAKRDLPWRRTRNPYPIWISEIMLQQTRVAAALPFFERFVSRFPTVQALADAAEADVLAHWAGLGYYSRARNLHKTARTIVDRGEFPGSYEGLLELPGIGEYTAGAIASIAYGQPHPAVDGNLLRVIARLDNDPSDIGNPGTRQRFTGRAAALLDPKHPGEFNQAMMEIGATICVPKIPRCGACPVAKFCLGLAAGRQTQLPVKARGETKIQIEIVTLLIVRKGRILLSRRPADAGQMAGFWELPTASVLPEAVVGREAAEFHHTITHHHYHFRVHVAEYAGRLSGALAWKPVKDLADVLLTTAARKALRLAALS